MSTVIGVDLGTTCSCVSVYKNGKVDIFPNDHNSRTTPSYIAFSDQIFIVGQEAKSHIVVDPRSVAYDSKRIIGRKYNDPVVAKYVTIWPFNVICDNGNPQISVMSDSEEKILRPEEVSAMILKTLKEIAEEKLGEVVSKAVITVPAYFNERQREATIEAAAIAKLDVVELIDEPTAAAIAFVVDKMGDGRKNVLVYDLGGGTFDVSVLTIEGGTIDVKAVNGNTNLGGRDFDSKNVDYFVKEIITKFGVNLKEEKYRKSLARLREKCEDLKIRLSAPKRVNAKIGVDLLFDGIDFVSEMTTSTFNEICNELIRSTLLSIDNALKQAKVRKEDVDEILLVGGSTRIPTVRQLVEEYFGKTVNKTLNPEEAVAAGAAIRSFSLCEDVMAANSCRIVLKNSAETSENERIICKNELENELFELKQVIKHSGNLMESNDLENFRGKINELINWVDQNSKTTIEMLKEKTRIVQDIKIEIETCKCDYGMKVKENFEKLKSVLMTLNTEIKNAEKIFESEYLSDIEVEVSKINQWFFVQENRTVNEIDEKLNKALLISTKLMERREIELKLPYIAKERKLLEDSITKAEQNLQEINFLCDKRRIQQAYDSLSFARSVLHGNSSEDTVRNTRGYVENILKKLLT